MNDSLKEPLKSQFHLEAIAMEVAADPKGYAHEVLMLRDQNSILQSELTAAKVEAGKLRAKGQDWVICSERLPTEEDEDYRGMLFIALQVGSSVQVREGTAGMVKDLYHNEGHAACAGWMPTGLRKPKPPRPQESQGNTVY